MNNISTIHRKLTDENGVADSKDLVLEFAKKLGWNPSYYIQPSSAEKSNGYLVIEHGLQNSAIISFLKERNEDLSSSDEENLLGLSYNNLVSWHITIDSRYINYYYVLNKEGRKVETRKIEVGNEEEALSVLTFYKVIEKKPNPNVKALDDVLIENISNWKRIISAELNNKIDLVSLSYLFNAVIFLRSIEDSKRRTNEISSNSKIFLEALTDDNTNISKVIVAVESKLNITIPDFIATKDKLKLFDKIHYLDLNRFFTSFYENEYNRFKYDFSIMTKQALSRIYQKYVSVLSIENTSNQLEAFPTILFEKINKDNGAYYTPEYIARFFAKYICKNHTEKEYDNLKILEPAVGSGIFLRTLLETQIEQRISKKIDLKIDELFNNVTGIDYDANACLSTNLSLTLLHYIFNNTFPKPNVFEGDSLQIMQDSISKGEGYDVIISNPPYINQDSKEQDLIARNKKIMEGLSNGKIDVYQAFVKLSIDILKPNGLGLFVIPHNFLISESSKKLRNYLLEHCNIELVADLSAINVFDKVGTYTILLIFRKKPQIELQNQNSVSWLLKCRSSVGDALSQLFQGTEIEEKQYQTYKAENYFKKDSEWFLLNKTEYQLLNKLKENKKIDSYLKLSQGVITGKDDIFKRHTDDIPKEEKTIYKSFLADKKISAYNIETKSTEYVFFPFVNNKMLTDKILASKFPKTWKYLMKNKSVLSNERADVKSGLLAWWKLHRPGNPEAVNAPKIVSPYLSISPKFSLDKTGRFVTFRSPYFILKGDEDADLLYYFLGILNSAPCYWVLSLQSNKQSSGYNIFHLNLLKSTPVPDPTLGSNKSLVSKMITTVKKRCAEKNETAKIDLEIQINNIACDLYKLTSNEKELLGL